MRNPVSVRSGLKCSGRFEKGFESNIYVQIVFKAVP